MIRQENMHKFFTLTALAMLASLLLSAGSATAGNSAFEPINPALSGRAGRRTPIVAAIEKTRPAVVSITVEITMVSRGAPFRRSPFQDEFFDRFFNDMWGPRVRRNTSLGSGVIIDGKDGIIVTNNHVVQGASNIVVTLSDGKEMPAELLGSDPRFDLAVLKVSPVKGLPEIKMGDSDGLMIGETVIAIGNPVGLSHTATTGVISATGRTLNTNDGESLQDIIQTDAAINPGNSGGPLLNINGEMIGINTAIVQGSTGLGFAIPSNQVKRITARLLRGDSGHLDLGLELAESGRPLRGETGCLIVETKAGGPAAAAGLKKGDMLMKLDGSPTSTVADYELILSSLTPGQTVAAEILRDDKAITVQLKPKELTAKEALELAWKLYGLKASTQKGMLVLSQPADGSPAHKWGVRAGDILLAIDGQETKNLADLAQVILNSRHKSAINIVIQRGRTVYRNTLAR